jgi:hypothetical protein
LVHICIYGNVTTKPPEQLLYTNKNVQKNTKSAGGMAQEAEHLSGIFEALNSIPSAVKKKKPEKNQCNLFL